jgi:CheY-like chemotaxis protein
LNTIGQAVFIRIPWRIIFIAHLFFAHPGARSPKSKGGGGMTAPRNTLSVGGEVTTPPHVLSVGNNPSLMASRTLILRGAGYLVEEAYTVDKAINLVAEDFIDAMLICHTVPRKGQQILISAARRKRSLMPILCLRSYDYESVPRTCIAVDNDPEALLNAVRKALTPPAPGSIA